VHELGDLHPAFAAAVIDFGWEEVAFASQMQELARVDTLRGNEQQGHLANIHCYCLEGRPEKFT
jgi:hypothetical protein